MTNARATFFSPSPSKGFLTDPPGTCASRASALNAGLFVFDNQLHLRPLAPPLRNLGRERAPGVIEIGQNLQQLFVCAQVDSVTGIVGMNQAKNHTPQRLNPARLGRPN